MPASKVLYIKSFRLFPSLHAEMIDPIFRELQHLFNVPASSQSTPGRTALRAWSNASAMLVRSSETCTMGSRKDRADSCDGLVIV
jgi:hypothetical protein